jgi:ribonuclease P protein component
LGISSKERIKKSKDIEKVFSDGKVLFSIDRKLKANYLEKNAGTEIKILFGVTVYKKTGTAVWRNRIKRLIREAYRKNKSILYDTLNNKKLLIYLIISPNSLNQKDFKKLSLSEIEPPVIELINKVAGAV